MEPTVFLFVNATNIHRSKARDSEIKDYALRLGNISKINATKVYQFKAKDSEIKDYTLCLGNIPKYFTTNNMRKIDLKETANDFSVDHHAVDTNDFLDIYIVI